MDNMITAAEAKKIADEDNRSFRYPENILTRIKVHAKLGHYDYSCSDHIDEPSIRGLRSLGFTVRETASLYFPYKISWKEANG